MHVQEPSIRKRHKGRLGLAVTPPAGADQLRGSQWLQEMDTSNGVLLLSMMSPSIVYPASAAAGREKGPMR